jgi:hypothetical protein
MRRLLALVLLAAPAALSAQVSGNSARASGMGNAYTALARGWEAVAWNPAMLGTRHQPGISIGLPQASGELGNNAFTVGDIRKYADQDLTDADKQYLLSRISNDDSTWIVRSRLGAQALALSVGPLAFSYSVSGLVNASASHDAVQFALNGNGAFSTGQNFFKLAGSGGNAWAASTLAGSYGRSFNTGLGRMSAGVTVKWVKGNFLGAAHDEGSQVYTDSVAAHGEVLYTEYPSGYEGTGDLFSRAPGHGLGVDLGGTLELGNHTLLSVVLVNPIGSMSWDKDRLRFDRSDYTLRMSASGVVSDTSNQTTLRGSAIDGDPAAAALRDSLLSNASFSKAVRAGLATRLAGITIGSDVAFRVKEGLDAMPAVNFGVGAEYVLLGFLPLRAGFRSDFDQTTAFSVGTGLKLGFFSLDVSAAEIMGSKHPGAIVGAGLGLSF